MILVSDRNQSVDQLDLLGETTQVRTMWNFIC